MKKQNDRCPLQQECERTCQVIGHERDCDYYVNNRYSTGGIPDQDEILTEEELRQEREREEKYLADLSLAHAEPTVYRNDYGTLFTVREHNGAPALMCKPLAADAWTLSGVLAAVQGEAYTAEDLQEVLDEYAKAHGWKKAKSESAAAPAPEDAGAVGQSLSAAGSASLAAKEMNAPAFDYSGLDGHTVEVLHLAESEIREARQVYICRVSAAVASAHDELFANCEGHNQHSTETFVAWCASVGLKKDAAYRLLQVAALLSGATPEEQATLEAASPSLLYAAAKPSAPAELVQAVKDGDITTHKQYQALLAKLKAAQSEKAAAERKATQCEEMKDSALETARQAQEDAANAESRARAAERERDEARKERDGAREALQASKMRGDRLKAENDDLKARPIEVPAVDEDEIDRRVEARLQQERDDSLAEQREIAARNAQDAILLLGRQINTSWQMVRPFLAEMEESRRVEAIDRINNEWAQTQKEILQCL